MGCGTSSERSSSPRLERSHSQSSPAPTLKHQHSSIGDSRALTESVDLGSFKDTRGTDASGDDDEFDASSNGRPLGALPAHEFDPKAVPVAPIIKPIPSPKPSMNLLDVQNHSGGQATTRRRNVSFHGVGSDSYTISPDPSTSMEGETSLTSASSASKPQGGNTTKIPVRRTPILDPPTTSASDLARQYDASKLSQLAVELGFEVVPPAGSIGGSTGSSRRMELHNDEGLSTQEPLSTSATTSGSPNAGPLSPMAASEASRINTLSNSHEGPSSSSLAATDHFDVVPPMRVILGNANAVVPIETPLSDTEEPDVPRAPMPMSANNSATSAFQQSNGSVDSNRSDNDFINGVNGGGNLTPRRLSSVMNINSLPVITTFVPPSLGVANVHDHVRNPI